MCLNDYLYIFISLSLILLASVAYSQETRKGIFSVSVGPSVPLSDFASDDLNADGAGGSGVGLNIGVQYVYPLSQNGLGIFAGIDFNYNGLSKDVKDEFEEIFKGIGFTSLDIKFSKYINIPITTGLVYSFQADEKIGVFANAGLAFNLLRITDLVVKSDLPTISSETDLAFSVGFKIGGGILINKKYSVSINYLGLGKHNVEGIAKGDGIYDEFSGEQKVDLLNLKFGVAF